MLPFYKNYGFCVDGWKHEPGVCDVYSRHYLWGCVWFFYGGVISVLRCNDLIPPFQYIATLLKRPWRLGVLTNAEKEHVCVCFCDFSPAPAESKSMWVARLLLFVWLKRSYVRSNGWAERKRFINIWDVFLTSIVLFFLLVFFPSFLSCFYFGGTQLAFCVWFRGGRRRAQYLCV